MNLFNTNFKYFLLKFKSFLICIKQIRKKKGTSAFSARKNITISLKNKNSNKKKEIRIENKNKNLFIIKKNDEIINSIIVPKLRAAHNSIILQALKWT